MRPRFWSPIVFGFLWFFSGAAALSSDHGHISGNIKSNSGAPLGDAIIKIFKTSSQGESFLVARSDRYGFFRKADLAPGVYYLQVSHQGYDPVTTAKVDINPGRTTALNIVLQSFIDYLSNNDDPRNWDFKTIMRSVSDRRLIFRKISSPSPFGKETKEAQFDRSGAITLASGASLNCQPYLIRSQTGQSGVTSNFAFSEPINQHSRMIFSGQMDFGYNSFWRLRNTYNYRPNSNHDYRVSVSYGQQDLDYPIANSAPAPVFLMDANHPESGMQTLGVELEGTAKFLDVLSVRYGLDYSRLHYAGDRSFTHPSLQIIITPLKGWRIKASYSSQRASDTNSVILPNGEQLNLSEPTIVTVVDNRVSMSQVKHAEFSAERTIASDTSVEVAVYNDKTRGPGLPIRMTTSTPSGIRSKLIELNENNSGQQGTRITVHRKFLDFLSGSLAYVYGEATNISSVESFASDKIDADLIKSLARQQYHHSVTGKINAKLRSTKTNLLAMVRWYPGNPVTPIDWFSDQMDIGTKSVNFEIRQVIPIPEFVGNSGRWQILIDLRNIFNHGKEVMPMSDGELVLNRNPRALRFGLNLSFQ